ncbi:MAG: UPF0104 family protein, partial [Bacteriovoracaceae bacterium]|nr:UPF0104 family protein [Bacteriovoracaceae bacterium]
MRFKSIASKALPLITISFLAVVLYFLFQIFSNIDWENVVVALSSVPLGSIGAMLVLVMINYSILSTYDYLGFHFLKDQDIGFKRIIPTALISYAFNFNLGALIGGLGFRIRVYSGWGISKKITSFVAMFSVTTTWLGFILLSSLIIILQRNWTGEVLDSNVLMILAAIGLIAVCSYLYFSYQQRTIRFRDNTFKLPTVRTALIQLILASAQWSVASFIVYTFMVELSVDISYGVVLFTYLSASLGGVIARIPAGLGVLEAIFIKLHPALPSEKVLAAILCFRAVYYIVPLIVAIPGYVGIEL